MDIGGAGGMMMAAGKGVGGDGDEGGGRGEGDGEGEDGGDGEGDDGCWPAGMALTEGATTGDGDARKVGGAGGTHVGDIGSMLIEGAEGEGGDDGVGDGGVNGEGGVGGEGGVKGGDWVEGGCGDFGGGDIDLQGIVGESAGGEMVRFQF